MQSVRICSFLPSGTEIVCALGLQEELLGRSHECDYPPGVRAKPAVVRALIDVEGRTPEEIDRAVRETMRERGTLYAADEERIRELAPDLVITQDLCRVCAPSGEDLNSIVRRLPSRPRVLSLNPKGVHGIFDNIVEVGDATGRGQQARRLAADLVRRIQAVQAAVETADARPRVFLMEWLEPIFCSGHWCPEMVEMAGGSEILGRAGEESRRVTWDEVVAAAPEVLVLTPCGFHLDRVLAQAPILFGRPAWSDLPAVRAGRVFAVDADSYFARPGPRVVDGIELLAHILHPDRFGWAGPSDAFRRIEG
jgi:iron complex transport system substrate-binding protein